MHPARSNDQCQQQPIRLALGMVLLVGVVFLGVSGCASSSLPPADMPWITVTRPLTPTVTLTQTQKPTLTRTPTPSPEFSSGFATILRMDGLMTVQVIGQSPQFAEPGFTIPAGNDTLIITTGIAELELSDGTQAFLGGNTTISPEFVASTSEKETVIQILQGSILVGSTQLTVIASTTEMNNPFQAHVTNGWMGVTYQPETGQFLVDCLTGICQIDDLALRRGQRRGFTRFILGELEAAQYDFWQALSLFEVLPLITSSPAPAKTSTPTPSLTSTRPSITIIPLTPAPTKTPKDEDVDPPTPKPTTTSTSVPLPTETATSASPP